MQKSTKNRRVEEVGGEPVPLSEHECLDRELLFITIARLQQVFNDFGINDPQDQADVISDIYNCIINKRMDRSEEIVEELADIARSLFSDLDLLKRMIPLKVGFLSKIPGQLEKQN